MPGFKIDQHSIGVDKPRKPMLQHMWIIQSIVGDAVPFKGSRNDGNPANPLVYIRSFTPPNYGFTLEDIDTGHITYKVARKINWEDVSLNFYGTIGLKDWLVEKRKQVWTPSEGIKYADDYKFTSVLKTLPIDWDGDINHPDVQAWTLMNSWVSKVDWCELTYTTSDMINVNVTLSYDWAIDGEVNDPVNMRDQ